MNYKAIIFDMDGTLIDSELFWPEVDREFLASYFSTSTDIHEFQKKATGSSFMGMYKALRSETDFPLTWDEFRSKRTELGLRHVYPYAKVMPGAADLLQRLTSSFPLALGSSSPHAFISFATEALQLQQYFRVMVSAEDVAWASKPDPDVFLECARKLGVLPSQCLVFEDSQNGVLSAKNAGMDVFAYRSDINQHQDLSSADRIFDSYFDLEI